MLSLKFLSAGWTSYAYEPLIEKELEYLLCNGILKKVNFSAWTTQIMSRLRALIRLEFVISWL
jgi:hypothetical protein